MQVLCERHDKRQKIKSFSALINKNHLLFRIWRNQTLFSWECLKTEFVKNFRSWLSVFSETSKPVPLSSSDDQLSEKTIRKLVTAIKGSDLLPSKTSQNRGLANTFTKTRADLQQNIDMLNFRTT